MPRDCSSAVVPKCGRGLVIAVYKVHIAQVARITPRGVIEKPPVSQYPDGTLEAAGEPPTPRGSHRYVLPRESRVHMRNPGAPGQCKALHSCPCSRSSMGPSCNPSADWPSAKSDRWGVDGTDISRWTPYRIGEPRFRVYQDQLIPPPHLYRPVGDRFDFRVGRVVEL